MVSSAAPSGRCDFWLIACAWRDSTSRSSHSGSATSRQSSTTCLSTRFRADPVDADRRRAAAHAISIASGDVDAETEAEFLDHLPRSTRLVALKNVGPFDAIVAGPFLSRLTHDVAEVFPSQTVLLPCWHDEPAARDSQVCVVRTVASAVCSIDTPQEQRFAEYELGMNHPNSSVIGTVIDTAAPGDARHGRDMVGGGRRYMLFAGRKSAEKGFDKLLGFMNRYTNEQPNRFSLAILGDGDSAGPAQPWIRNLGYLTDDCAANVMAGGCARQSFALRVAVTGRAGSAGPRRAGDCQRRQSRVAGAPDRRRRRNCR